MDEEQKLAPADERRYEEAQSSAWRLLDLLDGPFAKETRFVRHAFITGWLAAERDHAAEAKLGASHAEQAEAALRRIADRSRGVSGAEATRIAESALSTPLPQAETEGCTDPAHGEQVVCVHCHPQAETDAEARG